VRPRASPAIVGLRLLENTAIGLAAGAVGRLMQELVSARWPRGTTRIPVGWLI